LKEKVDAKKKVRSSIAWYPMHLEWAKKEANRLYEGSVSMLVGKLVEERMRQKANEIY